MNDMKKCSSAAENTKVTLNDFHVTATIHQKFFSIHDPKQTQIKAIDALALHVASLLSSLTISNGRSSIPR